jgi:hypothetical protein
VARRFWMGPPHGGFTEPESVASGKRMTRTADWSGGERPKVASRLRRKLLQYARRSPGPSIIIVATSPVTRRTRSYPSCKAGASFLDDYFLGLVRRPNASPYVSLGFWNSSISPPLAKGPVTTSPATIVDSIHCLPFSESPSNPTGIGPTEDDVSLVWLDSSCKTVDAVQLLEKESPASKNIAGIGQIFYGPAIKQMFNAPGLPPDGDPRTPDFIVTPNVGVTYSGSTAKQAEHGGFSHDDTNVIILLSNPSFLSKTITSPVETMQIAPTILKALGFDPASLQAVQEENTQVLPGVPLWD